MGVDSVANFLGQLSSAHRLELADLPLTQGSIAVLAAGLVLAGCAKELPLRSDDQTRMVPNEQAIALPDVGGPAVTAVLETRFSNSIQQDVLLATSASTSGQNMLRVQVFGPVETKLAGGSSLRAGFLPAKNVNAEMRELFPGVRMQTSNFYVQNKYGAFGYAVGRSNSGTTCFYGWQRITSTGFTQTWIGNKGAIQVRLRLCDDTASEQRLLQSMYGYSINASFRDKNWNPYGEPLPPDATLGRPGAPIYPVSASRFETVTEPLAQLAPPPARRQAPRREVADVQTAPRLPTPTGPMVPPPPGGGATSSSTETQGPVPTLNQPGAAPIVPLPPQPANR